MTEPIIKTVVVNCDAGNAFDVFVEKTATWWPLEKHSISAGAGEMSQNITIEPALGGAVYEIMHDGTRTEWGKVTHFDQGRAMAMTWNPGGSAEADTLVEVVFEDLPDGRCKVTLTHHAWENLGVKADEMRAGYNQGWVHVFDTCFAGAF